MCFYFKKKIKIEEVFDKVFNLPSLKENIEMRGRFNCADMFDLEDVIYPIYKILNKTNKYDNDYPSGIWTMEVYELRQILSKLKKC